MAEKIPQLAEVLENDHPVVVGVPQGTEAEFSLSDLWNGRMLCLDCGAAFQVSLENFTQCPGCRRHG